MFDGVAGTTAVTLTAKRTAAAAPIPAWPSRPSAKSSAQQAASWIAQALSWAAAAAMPRRGSRKTASPARTWSRAPVHGGAEPGQAAVAVAAHQQRGEEDDEQQDQRHEAEGEELLGAGVEERRGRDDDHAEQGQGDQVEHRLGDEGAEQDREGLPHAAGAAGEGQRPRRLAEAGRQGRRHQHADHRRRGDVAAADRAVGQRRADDPVPGGGAEEERERHQRAGDQRPR